MSVAIGAALTHSAMAGANVEKWAFWNQHLTTLELSAAFSNVVKRASDLGFRQMVVASGLGYYSCLSDSAKASVRSSLQYVRDCGMGITASVWSLGYGAMVNYGCEFVEGAPVKDVKYVVDKSGKKATFVPSPVAAQPFPNGGFEDYTVKRGFSGFTFIDGNRGESAWIRQDRSVRHSGEASLVCDMGKGQSRVKGQTRLSQVVSLIPNRHYRLTAYVKWEGFNPAGNPIQMSVYREKGEGKLCMLTKCAPRAESSDWMKLETEFNSVEYGDLRVWLGVWDSSQTGRFWVDDISLVETAPRGILHNYGAPITVQRSRDGYLLVEGLDYSFPFLEERLPKEGDAPVELTVLRARKIRPGEELVVTYYTPMNSGSGSDRQVSICPSNPALYRMLAASARTIQEAVQPDGWLLSFDEWRSGNACAACQARNMTLPAMIADCASRCNGIIRGLNPSADVWIWSDMFCPYENAHPVYYAVRGRCDSGLEFLPKEIGVACWGAARNSLKSTSLFEAAGHRTFAAAYYDEDETFADTRLWIDTLKASRSAPVICYTTWRRDYRQLENWSRLVDEAFKGQPSSVK